MQVLITIVHLVGNNRPASGPIFSYSTIYFEIAIYINISLYFPISALIVLYFHISALLSYIFINFIRSIDTILRKPPTFHGFYGVAGPTNPRTLLR